MGLDNIIMTSIYVIIFIMMWCHNMMGLDNIIMTSHYGFGIEKEHLL